MGYRLIEYSIYFGLCTILKLLLYIYFVQMKMCLYQNKGHKLMRKNFLIDHPSPYPFDITGLTPV